MSETHVHGIDEANMERRTFLKGSMTAAALLGAAGMFGCAPNAAKQEGVKQEEAETADMPDTGAVDPTAEYECWLPPQGEVAFESEPVTDIAQTEDWDVVIVGMGAAGSAAAAYASANGLKTLVVEKMSVPAANPGDIFVINSKVQEQHQFPCPTADGSVAVIGQMIEEGALIQADTVEELAEKMGVDAATLKETFERTTRDAASGVDTLFEKEFLYPLDTPPFYAIHEGSTLLSTCSGLHTDEVARVVTPEGDVIPGLYAIGECAGGLWAGGMYTHHVYGGDWAAAITFAYLAVQDLLAA